MAKKARPLTEKQLADYGNIKCKAIVCYHTNQNKQNHPFLEVTYTSGLFRDFPLGRDLAYALLGYGLPLGEDKKLK